MKRIYLDWAATTPVFPEVVEEMARFWRVDFGNASSLHRWGREARKAIEEARERVAGILNCQPEEVYFTGTTTTSDNLAILGVARAAEREGKTGLVTSQIEHHAVLDTFKQLENNGFEVNYLRVDKEGVVDVKELEEKVDLNTVLVSVMYANNEVGTIQPIEEIGRLLKKKQEEFGNRIFFHTDAAAVAEYLSLDVQKLGVDLMSLGAHKFGGPKGVGILFVRKGVRILPITFGGHHGGGLWPGTEAVPLIVGMAKALELAQSRTKETGVKVKRLRDKLIEGVLKRVPDCYLTGHPSQRLPDIASFVFKGVEGEAILLRLDDEGIAASSGSACTSGDLRPSHVLLAMGIPEEEAHGSIRFSLGRETSEEEIDLVVEVLPKVIDDLRRMAPKI